MTASIELSLMMDRSFDFASKSEDKKLIKENFFSPFDEKFFFRRDLFEKTEITWFSISFISSCLFFFSVREKITENCKSSLKLVVCVDEHTSDYMG